MLFGGRQDGSLFRHRKFFRSPRARGIQQAVQPLLQPTLFPMQRAARAHSGLRLDLPQGNTLGQQQQHPCSTHQSGRERGGAHDLLQAIQILGWQLKGFVASEHEPI